MKKSKITIGVISAVIVVAFLIWYFWPVEPVASSFSDTTTGKVISNTTTEKVIEGDGCPPEVNRDYFYGLRSSNARGFYKSLEPDRWEFLDNKGSITGYFSEGSLEGQNINYMYSNPDMFYERWRLNEEGLINEERWDIDIVYNRESCESLEWYKLPDKIESYESYVCELVSLKCSKL